MAFEDISPQQGIGLLQGLYGLGQGAAHQDPLGAIRNLNRMLGTLGNLGEIPGLSEAAGIAGGPLGLITGLLHGDPISSAMGGIQTASGVSGAFGGPTISSLASQLASQFGIDLAPFAGGGLAGAGLGAMASVPIMMAMGLIKGGMDMPKMQKMAQGIERKYYQGEWPGMTQARMTGAGLLPHLGDIANNPDLLMPALAAATRGIRASDLAPAYSNLSGTEGGKANDLSQWAAGAPELEGKNWGSWLGLMDAAERAGLNPAALQAASVIKSHEQPSVHRHQFGPPGEGMQVGGQMNPITDYHASSINLQGGRTPLRPGRDAAGNPIMLDASTWQPGDTGLTTQEADDISNSLAGLGQQFGINWGARGSGATGSNQGYTILPDQLAAYGFTPGHYGAAALNYLSQLDPSVTQSANWQPYMHSMGVTPEMLAGMPRNLAPLSGNPFASKPVTEADEISRLFGNLVSYAPAGGTA